ncbi:hypothetical protein L0222_17100 [bacterium]|nr:hypothetical protein [bacterium]MCI0602896.1 hypothetical protein [bacterium]
MTTEQWNEYGYAVVIDEGFVYLVRIELQVGYVTQVDNGSWNLYLNVNRFPWRFINLSTSPHILALARAQLLKNCA